MRNHPLLLSTDLFTSEDVERFWSKVKRSKSCWLWKAGVTVGGYGKFYLRREDRKFTLLAHRVSLFLHSGESPQQLVLHRCDRPSCVNPDHLFVGTDIDNINDKLSKGRGRGWRLAPRPGLTGERHHRAKLSDEKVRQIRELFRSGESKTVLGQRFGVSDVNIHAIVVGKTWRHVT